MGHSSAHITLPINASNRFDSADELLWSAVQKWRDEEANREDSANAGWAVLAEPMPLHQAHAFIDDLFEREGTSASAVVPIIADTVSVEKTVKVTVDGDTLRKLARSHSYQGREILHGILAKEHGDGVDNVEVISLPKPRKAVATATEGKAVTSYIVVSDGRPVDRGATQAEARQKAIDYMNANPAASGATVEAVVSRDTGGKALVSVTRPVPEEGTVTVKMTLTTPKKGAQPTEYLVVFDYHH